MEHNVAYYRILHGTNGVSSEKEAQVRSLRRSVENDFRKTINWEKVSINGSEDLQEVEILPGESMSVKSIKARPGESLHLGDCVLWRECRWLVTELDCDDQISYQGSMTQCNYRLRWQLADSTLYEEYGVWEDKGSSNTGEDYGTYMDTPDASFKVLLPMNEETLKLHRGSRFLAGNHGYDGHALAFEAERVNPISYYFVNGEEDGEAHSGLLELTLAETQFNPDQDSSQYNTADYDETSSGAAWPQEEDTDPEGSEWFG